MPEVKEQTAQSTSYYGDVKSHQDDEFAESKSLWKPVGVSQTDDVVISPTKAFVEDPNTSKEHFRVNLNVPGVRAHYIHMHKKRDMLFDYFQSDSPRDLVIKLIKQVPRDPKEVVATYEWMKTGGLMTAAKAKERIASHKKAYAAKDIRLAIIRIM